MKHLLPLSLALAVATGSAHAGFQAVRIADPASRIGVDGKLDEAPWRNALAHDTFYQTQPEDKVAAKVRTEVRIVYDKKYLYVGIKAFDPNPDLIREPMARRDKVSRDQDFIGLYIDPSGRSKSAQFIYVNARGAISDGNYTDSNGDDTAPDFDFDAATARFDGGWSTEVRIPFSSIAYVAGQAEPWKLLVLRNMTREQRYRMYSGRVTRESSCNLCFSDSIDGLRDLPTGLNWSATPQLVLRRATEDVAGAPRTSSSGRDLSLDVKVRPDSASTIDATINPDFSQIELDAPQLSGNTRFGLFVEEKRPFFLEGSDILNTPLRAVSTRSITDPTWGLRYTRRDADKDVTILTNRDAGGGLVMLPGAYGTNFASQDFSSQATIARANFRLGALSLGAVATDRTITGGRGYNRVAGSDFVWQRTDTERVRGQLLVSGTTAQSDGKGSLALGAATHGHALELDYLNETSKWAIWARHQGISEDFRADNGFISQAGFRNYASEFTRKFGKTGILNELNLFVYLEREYDASGKLIQNDYAPGIQMSAPYDIQAVFLIKPSNHLRVRQDGELFKTAKVFGRVEAAPGRVLARVAANLDFGDQVDVESSRLGRGGTLNLVARVRPLDRLEFEPSYSRSWIDGKSGIESGRRLYTEQALQLNGILHFGPKDSLRMILQRTRTRRDPSLYAVAVAPDSSGGISSLVYGHAASLGTAAFAGLTVSTGDTPGFSPKRTGRELFVKLSWQI